MFNTIKKKILAGNSILLVILLLVLVFALIQLNHNQQLLAEEKGVITILTEIGDIQQQLLEFRLAATEFTLLMQDSSKKKRDSNYEKLHTGFSTSAHSVIKEKTTDLEQYNSKLQQAVTAFINDDKMQGSILLSESTAQSAEILKVLKSTYQQHQDKVAIIQEEVHDSNTRVSFSLYSLLVVMLVVGVGISFFLANLISKGLIRLQTTVEEIEKNGDLTLRSNIQSNDEVGRLSSAFNRLIENLGSIVSQVKTQADQLATAAEQLSSVTEQTNQGVQQQSDEIRQVATAMNEMSATVQEISSNAEYASQSAKEGNGAAENGRNVVHQTISAINVLASDVQSSADVMEKLKVNSENIGTVLDVIKGIAEQTNLLALNAAIEAARAGEQGRGFAVVADEVRTLAKRTQDSTKEIEILVEALQGGAEQAVNVMEKSRDKAADTVNQAQHAGESLDAITHEVGNILDVNTQIASAAEEQSVTTEEINRNINNIQTIAEQTALGAEQTAASSNELTRLGEHLRSMVAQFKV